MKYLIPCLFLVLVQPLFAQTPFLRKAKVGQTDIILFSDGTWQYYKPVDVAPLFPAYSRAGASSSCKELFCRPVEPGAEILRIPCFKPGDIARDSDFFRCTTEYYKEVPQDEFLQVRMKYTGRQVKTLLAGEKMQVFAMDSSHRRYLVKIFHRNGLESWYYPLLSVQREIDVSKPGKVIGVSAQHFYWQIRVHNHTIGIAGLFHTDFSCITDDILIDAKNLIDPNFSLRGKAFLAGIGKQSADQTPAPDFNRLLNEELKNKNQAP